MLEPRRHADLENTIVLFASFLVFRLSIVLKCCGLVREGREQMEVTSAIRKCDPTPCTHIFAEEFALHTAKLIPTF